MVAAIVGAGVAIYGATQQSKAAKKSQKSGDAASARQEDIAQQNLDWQKGRYNEWHDTFMPVLSSIRDEAMASGRPDFATVSADVNTAFDTSQGINKRQMERMGVRPTDGATAASNTAYGLGRATATVMGRQSERRSAMDDRYNKLSDVYRMGEGMRGDSAAGVSNANGTMGNIYGATADRNYGAAQASGQAAGALTSQAISMGMGAANSWASKNTPNTAPVASSPAWGVSSGGQSPWQTPNGGY